MAERLSECFPIFMLIFVSPADDDVGVNAELKYSLTGVDSSKFSINEDNGTITITGTLDYEVKKSYVLTAIVCDQGPGNNNASEMVIVNVTDVNDNEPVFQGTPYVVQVLEKSSIGTFVINVNATDKDSGMKTRVKSLNSLNYMIACIIFIFEEQCPTI